MSVFGKLLKGKKEDDADPRKKKDDADPRKKKDDADPSEAIKKLRDTEELLGKKQEYLEKKIEEFMLAAKTNASKNKRVALQALKKKKRLEKIQLQIDSTLTTIEMQRELLEDARTNKSVLDSMKTAADALKKAHKNLDITDIHNIVDDIAEQHDIANEITNVIGTPIRLSDYWDEEELENELEELEQECLEEELLKVPGSSQLPAIPTMSELKSVKLDDKKAEDEEEIKKLQAWAS